MRTDTFHDTLLIAGSRKFSHSDAMHAAVDRVVQYALDRWKVSDPTKSFLYCLSGTQKGADTLGEAWARRNQVPVQRFAPSALLESPDSFHVRNELMAMMIPHVILLFWRTEETQDVRELLRQRDHNRGTLDMLKRAEKHRTRQWVYHGLRQPILIAIDEQRQLIREIPYPPKGV